MLREKIAFSKEEKSEFERLPSFSPIANATKTWDFWKAVANKRGLDYTTINGFTALPLDHDKHWCWPSALNMNNRSHLQEGG